MGVDPDDPVVAPRRAVALLKEAPEKIDLLLKWCPDRDAARRAHGGAESIADIVARLGTLDRHHFLESAKKLCSGEEHPALPAFPIEDPPSSGELPDRELAELLTRFRHVRAQSTEFLEGLPEDAWQRAGEDPALGPVTLTRLVAHWIRHDAAAIARLGALCGELGRSESAVREYKETP
jgi:hypothetical protein